MGLFNTGEFRLHSGRVSPFKIDCDALTDDDLDALARVAAKKVGAAPGLGFRRVEGVPTGGLRFAAALGRHVRLDTGSPWVLIADDVLTTGGSMLAHRGDRAAVGVVIFARGPCPAWVTPLFEMRG